MTTLLYLKLAWRNILRNKRRTFIAGIAIGIGLAALMFTDALYIGMEDNMVQSATDSFLGDGQIHRDGYRESREVTETINGAPDILRRLDTTGIVVAHAERVYAMSMISSPSNVESVSLVGIEPGEERVVSQIDDALQKGDFFEGNNARDVVMGSDLADLLEVGIGDRIVLTVAQAKSGDLSQEMFRVSGIYFFHMKELDRGMVFIRKAKAQSMLGLAPDQIHEIALKFTSTSYGRNKNYPFWKEFSTNGNEAVGWTVLLPQMEAVFEMSNFSTAMIGLVLFGVVALGIVNTLFMSLYERMFEFGVLRAVGTRPFAMGRLIIFEAGALAAISIVMGVILGTAVTYIFTRVGIDYTGIEFAGVTFQQLLYPVMKVKQFVIYPIAVFFFTLLVGLYPATFAARMRPAEAMRRSV
jgi:ABC-type lipoprotein release transport system permease subunit